MCPIKLLQNFLCYPRLHIMRMHKNFTLVKRDIWLGNNRAQGTAIVCITITRQEVPQWTSSSLAIVCLSGSFKALFWQHQKEATEKSCHWMRSHDTVEHLLASPIQRSVWNTERQWIHLPSITENLTRLHKLCESISRVLCDVDWQLIQAMSWLETWESRQKLVVLLLDEMHI